MKRTLLTIASKLLFASLLLTIACKPKEEPKKPEASWPKGVCYEIFIQSFADSNGDGIGDIPGATSRLDYLQDLGVRAVWLMPIMPSPSYHKYDVTDYRNIHPDYGTLADFKTFVQEAHKRNIKVIMDMIINHTSSQHPWFLSAKKGPDSPYRDWYVWADKDSIANQIAKKETTQDSDNITQWHAVDGDTTKEHYYGFFNGNMPDLNYDNPDVRKEMISIGKFWLKDMDVDGFRLDAAKHIYPDDRIKDNQAWWEEYQQALKKVKPDVYLVGEVWASSDIVKQFVKGLPSLFDFDLAGSINQSVINETSVASTINGPRWENVKNENLVDRLIKLRKMYQSVNPDFVDATFLSNHDQNRVLSNFDGNIAKGKLAASILLTLPGAPYIYYGEEIGMLGQKPDEHIREPFLWNKKAIDTSRTTWIEPTYSMDSTVTPAMVQENDPNSILNHYKTFIHLRNNTPALLEGKLEKLTSPSPHVLAFQRVWKEKHMAVYHNLSGEAVSIPVSPDEVKKGLFYGKDNYTSGDQKVMLKPYKSLLFRMKE